MKAFNVRLEHEKGLRLAIRVGSHTGLTVVGDIGSSARHELLALGEAPNIAARIQSLVAPDTIGISRDTYRLVEGYFDCRDLGFHDLKGVTGPVRIYRALRESGKPSRLDAFALHEFTPLVGRDLEVTLLLAEAQGTDTGQGRVVLLTGEPGIGKSRLLEVLKEHVSSQGYMTFECRCSQYHQNSPMYPLMRAWERHCGFAAEDSTDARAAKLEACLTGYRLPLEETVPLFAGFLSLSLPEDRYAPLSWTPQQQRQKLSETITTIIQESTERKPVLFIVEDLHWADPTSLEFLDLLIDQAPAAAILAVLTCRPVFQPRLIEAIVPISPGSPSIPCPATRSNNCAAVAAGRTLPAEIVRQLVEKSDGVPLFIEEMTKTVWSRAC